MTDLTDYTQDEILSWSFLGDAMPTAPGTIYIALHTSDPGNQPDGSTEVSASDYSRVSVSAGTGQFTLGDNGDASTITNDNEINFGVASNNWGTISHFSVWDGSATTDNPLWAADLSTSKTIETNDELRFQAGDLTAEIN